MSGRTIVGVEPGMDALLVKLLKAPVLIGAESKWLPFNCDPDELPDWTDAEAVERRGRTILDRLKDNPAVKEAIEGVLRTPPGEVSSIYFKLTHSDAERICWETLCDTDGNFLALDRRWPIARMADSMYDRPMSTQEFAGTLRILAVIAALGLDGRKEWEGIKAAVEKARADGLDIRLLVLTGRDEVTEAVKDAVNGGLTGVKVRSMPGSRSELAAEVEEFKPQIMHFFCHGRVDIGVAQLELATRLDEQAGTQVGSVRLKVSQENGIPAVQTGVWLVTLNCCEGARSTQDLFSIAYNVVASGVPAAIGMLEPIDAEDAHAFCGGLYPALLKLIHETVQGAAPGETRELSWVMALHLPRNVLSEKHDDDPKNNREWVLPVLYVRPDAFQIRVVGQADAIAPEDLENMTDKAEEVAAALRALPPGTPEFVRKQLLEIIEDIPPSMRPDLNGDFSSGG